MLQIASIQAQIRGTFCPSMDRVENEDKINMGVLLPEWYIFTSNL